MCFPRRYYSCGAVLSLPFIVASALAFALNTRLSSFAHHAYPELMFVYRSVNVGWPNAFAGAGADSFDAGGREQWLLLGWQVNLSGFTCFLSF
jgi:hypothetical protein